MIIVNLHWMKVYQNILPHRHRTNLLNVLVSIVVCYLYPQELKQQQEQQLKLIHQCPCVFGNFSLSFTNKIKQNVFSSTHRLEHLRKSRDLT